MRPNGELPLRGALGRYVPGMKNGKRRVVFPVSSTPVSAQTCIPVDVPKGTLETRPFRTLTWRPFDHCSGWFGNAFVFHITTCTLKEPSRSQLGPLPRTRGPVDAPESGLDG